MKNTLHAFVFFLFFIQNGVLGNTANKKRKSIPLLPEKPVIEIIPPEKSLERVDPHGKSNLKPSLEEVQSTDACLVCHGIHESKLITKSISNETCFNCHNQSPHSGIVEHRKHKVSCLDCHSVHRGKVIPSESGHNFFKNQFEKKIDEGLVYRKSTSPMLKKNCLECHTK